MVGSALYSRFSADEITHHHIELRFFLALRSFDFFDGKHQKKVVA